QTAIRECREMLSAFYRDPDVPLGYALSHEATHVYSLRDPNDATLAAVFFGRMPERVEGIDDPVVYMGLGAQRRAAQTQGSARTLLLAFLADVRAAAGPEQKVLAWYRTATPFGLAPAHTLLRSGEPATDGGASAFGIKAIQTLRRSLGIPTD